MFPIEGSNGTEFWVCSDRGVNIDGANANTASCRPTYDKIYSFPSYVPKIHRIRLIGDSVQILQTITIKRPNGTGASGILNPTGFGSTAAEQASNDTVQDCANFNSRITAKDTFGIDAEGLVVDKQGNFWLCEEGGVSIWKLNSNGVLTARYTPFASKAGAQSVDIAIDSVFGYRKNNRGFEGIALSPSGKIFAFIQSPILYPTKNIGEASRIHRILEIDPSTGTQKMYAYINDGIIGASGSNQIRMRDWKIGDMAAINDTTFLVLEAAIRGTSDFRRLYQININGATNVTSGLYNTNKTLEALVDSAGLVSAGITPVKKTLVMDLLANSWPAALEKAEGLAIINDSTIAICNDNDYGQVSPSENGIATATGINSHVLVYSLSGNNKLKNFIPVVTNISQGVTGISSSKAPYFTATQAGASVTSIMTAGDKVNGYQLNGIPDGMGAIDLGNGTFNLYVAHEFTPTSGVVRAHGTKGAYISQLNIDKNTLAVRSGADLIQNVKLWKNGQYVTSNVANLDSINGAFSRFCSGEIPVASAFYNAATGKGSLARMFMNGEETGAEGRAFAHILTGTETGTSYQLPYLGRFSWENAVASPNPSDLTVVAGMDDATPGQVYFYVGAKSDSGNEIEKAGLAHGKLYGVAVNGLATETSSLIAANTTFSMVDLGYVRDSSGAALETKSTALGVTRFLRPEDGLFDPANPNDFYFVTTNSMSGPSRMYRLRFTNINDVTLGGTVTAVIDGTEGPKMMDNIGSDRAGHIYIQEDPGNNVHIAKVWQYNVATDSLFEIARFDSTYFLTGKPDFLTQDEESSGLFDAQDILGPGKFIMNAQIHKFVGGEMVELGQLVVLNSPDAAKSLTTNTGFSSSKAPYFTATQAGASVTSIMTAGDKVNGYQLNGIPDGMGAIDLGNGTFNLYVAHEFTPTSGVVRAHGTKGAYISQLNIDKNTLAVRSGADLIQNVKLWKNGQYVTSNVANLDSINGAFSRFCSGEIPVASAFYNAATGKGSLARMFMNGEETGAEGRAFAHILTGTETGTSYQLPYLGRFSWENAVASPNPSDLTVVAGMDDATPGQVYFYVGAKSDSGNEIEKAGLAHGKLYGVAVNGLATETSSLIAANTTFSMVDLGYVRDSSGAALETKSTALGVTRFLRPEDGLFDPANPNDFYFVTTNSMSGPSRMYRLRFTNINDVTLGGTVTAVIDGTEGPKMMDNIGSDRAGHIYIQEDPGNNVHIAKVWQYNVATDSLFEIARFDSTYFLTGKPDFLTQDEESSGLFDAQDILGPGKFIMNAQIHKFVGGEMVELGQLVVLNSPDAAASNPEIGVFGNNTEIKTINNIKEPNYADSTLFNQQSLNSKSIRNYSIRNSGQSALTISGISFAGNSSSDFSLLNLPTFPVTVNAGSSLNFAVQYRPIVRTNSTALVKIQSNDFDEAVSIFRVNGTACSGAPINNTTAISGLSNVCLKMGTTDTVYYSIAENATATSYAWTLPTGVTMVTGNGTSRIGVTFGNNFVSNSQIRVKPSNACGLSSRFSIISLSATPPTSLPVFTQSTTSVCGIKGTATNATYTVSPIAGTNSYQWTVPTGATIVSGQGTNSIVVNFNAGFTSGNITVKGSTPCGFTPIATRNIVLLEKPVISGASSLCPGETETFSVPVVIGATRYRFNLPAGLTLVSQNNNSALISNNGSFVSGKIGVQVQTATCGWSQPGSISVNTAACRSISETSVSLYPNPSNGNFEVRFAEATTGNIAVYDLTGKIIANRSIQSKVENFDERSFSNGIYFVHVVSNGNTTVFKMVVSK